MKRKDSAKLPLTRETLTSISGGPYVRTEVSALETTCVTLNQCVATQYCPG